MLVAWLAMWGEISAVNVVSGIGVVAIVSLFFRRAPDRSYSLRPLGIIRLLAIFVWRLITSSANVVVTVLAPTPARLRSGVVGVQLSHPSPLVAAIVADAISLTPGTLTLEARYPDEQSDQQPTRREPPTLFIHVLGLDDPEAVRADVRVLERLVLAAVTPNSLHELADEVAP